MLLVVHVVLWQVVVRVWPVDVRVAVNLWQDVNRGHIEEGPG